jgi:hypothetical protein
VTRRTFGARALNDREPPSEESTVAVTARADWVEARPKK